MIIQDLRLQNFRSYGNDSFEFNKGVNIIVGPNASGKTNLLEAILVVARGKSYRVKDAELIQFKQPWSRLDAHIDGDGTRTVKLVTQPRFVKAYEIDGRTFQRLTLAHSLPVVLFEPNHLSLLSGSPEQRRSYLDDLLEQIQPAYGPLRRQYKRILAQRNALLKRGWETAQRQIFPWNVRLSELASKIIEARTGLIDDINTKIGPLYQDLSHTASEATVCYRATFPLETYGTQLLHKLESSLSLDCQRGFTGSGPHREDFDVLLNGHPAQETASRGELRTLVLALKIIELETIEAARAQTPLLLLDDVFSELDGARRRALTSYLKNYQTFITTTDADVVVKHFINDCNIIPIQSR